MEFYPIMEFSRWNFQETIVLDFFLVSNRIGICNIIIMEEMEEIF